MTPSGFAYTKWFQILGLSLSVYTKRQQGGTPSNKRRLTFKDREALPLAKLGLGFIVPPASHMTMTPLPSAAFSRSVRKSTFSSTGLQHMIQA